MLIIKWEIEAAVKYVYAENEPKAHRNDEASAFEAASSILMSFGAQKYNHIFIMSIIYTWWKCNAISQNEIHWTVALC